MARRYRPEKFDLESDALRRQQNTLWPDAVRNGSSVDRFLWKGLPNATPIQRAGAIVFGTIFLASGFALQYIACDQRILVAVPIASLSAMAGWKIFANGLPFTLRESMLRPITIVLPMLALMTYFSWPLYHPSWPLSK